jgi:hypothetical protein
LITQLVHCRTGSLEIYRPVAIPLYKVHCRTGSLENNIIKPGGDVGVHCRTGSLENSKAMGWFYGFKLHLIVNYQGEIVAAKVTTGNVHDTKPVALLAQGLTDKL